MLKKLDILLVVLSLLFPLGGILLYLDLTTTYSLGLMFFILSLCTLLHKVKPRSWFSATSYAALTYVMLRLILGSSFNSLSTYELLLPLIVVGVTSGVMHLNTRAITGAMLAFWVCSIISLFTAHNGLSPLFSGIDYVINVDPMFTLSILLSFICFGVVKEVSIIPFRIKFGITETRFGTFGTIGSFGSSTTSYNKKTHSNKEKKSDNYYNDKFYKNYYYNHQHEHHNESESVQGADFNDICYRCGGTYPCSYCTEYDDNTHSHSFI